MPATLHICGKTGAYSSCPSRARFKFESDGIALHSDDPTADAPNLELIGIERVTVVACAGFLG